MSKRTPKPRRHRNTSRLTARERAEAFFCSAGPQLNVANLTKLLEAHAAATLARAHVRWRRSLTMKKLTAMRDKMIRAAIEPVMAPRFKS